MELVLVLLFSCSDKVPFISNLREERFCWLLVSEYFSPSLQEGMAVGVASSCWCDRRIWSQRGDSPGAEEELEPNLVIS